MDNPPGEGGGTGAKGFERLVPEGIIKSLISGVGTLFMSEEGIRSMLGEMKLPKEVAQFLINQASKTKEELLRVLAHEMRDFLESASLADELRRLLTSISLEINTNVRFVAVDNDIKPQTKVKVRLKGNKKRDSNEPAADEG